ncbi:MAG: hypothetical protein RJB13_1882 [Pseudomonadota bacterium]
MMVTQAVATQNSNHNEANAIDRLENAAQRVRNRLSVWSRREEKFALLRLGCAALLIMVLSGFYSTMSASQVAVGWVCFFVFFFILSAIHRRLKKVRERCDGVLNVLTSERHRLMRDWESLRQSRSRQQIERWQETLVVSSEHPYRSDLELTGSTQLWLDTCTLPEGSVRLANELLSCATHPPAQEELNLRKDIVAALAVHSQALRRWESYRFGESRKEFERPILNASLDTEVISAQQNLENDSERTPRGLIELSVATIALVQLWIWLFQFFPAMLKFLETSESSVLNRPLTSLFPVLLLGAVLWESWRKRVQASEGMLGLRELKVLEALEDVARFVPEQSRLIPVSEGRRFKLLRATFELGEVRRNPIVWLLLNVLIPYDALSFVVTLLAHRVIDGRFQQWWKAVVEFDFLAALARIKLENKEFVWAEPSQRGVLAIQMGHPLLRRSVRVGHNIDLNEEQRCMLLTGSNMSGKSTLLRALAFNTLLRQLGTVVCAQALTSPRLEVLCAIQVTDSLESGASYFYAEVKRLAGLLKRLQEKKEAGVERLFLIDEIFRGTNNRERFIGSWQVIAALVSSGALGILTTHDLALTSLEKVVFGVKNFHLRETVGADGLLEFDYILRDGPCPTTNALIIMKHAGLPVDIEFKLKTEEGSPNV